MMTEELEGFVRETAVAMLNGRNTIVALRELAEKAANHQWIRCSEKEAPQSELVIWARRTGNQTEYGIYAIGSPEFPEDYYTHWRELPALPAGLAQVPKIALTSGATGKEQLVGNQQGAELGRPQPAGSAGVAFVQGGNCGASGLVWPEKSK